MDLSELCGRLDERLDTAAYADLDASANGLQVGPEAGEVETVAVAVDAAQATAAEAIDRGADLMITHHGYVWGSLDRVTGRTYDRVAPHVEHDLPLYVAHLPLDGHQELGNAAGVADLLNLRDREPFGAVGPAYAGQRGTAREPYSAIGLRETLAAGTEGDQPVRMLDFGPEELREIAVVTGSGADYLDEAVAAGADALVTGEGKQQVYHEAREAGVTVALAGHYATETFGVRALAGLCEEWGLETTYISHPTGL